MIYRLFLFLTGSTVYRVGPYRVQILSYILKNRLPVFGIHRRDNDLVFYSSTISRRRVLKDLKKLYGVSYEGRGLPALLARYRKRFGIYAGILVFIFIIWFSSSVIWQINVIGNESIEDKEIIEKLDGAGFRVGSFIPSADVRLLCSRCLHENPDISWMSINIIGTCADIRVRERIAPPDGEEEQKDLPSVITAERDGFIERIELRGGQIIINSGQSVKKGETVISGVIPVGEKGFRLVRSDADVFARTIRRFRVEIPLSYTEQIREKTGKTGISFIFFSSEIKLTGSGAPDGCEQKSVTEYITLPGGIALPFGIVKTECFAVSEGAEIALEEKEARRLADVRLAEIIGSELAGAESVSISKEYREEDGALVLEAEIVCIENIAKERALVTSDYFERVKPVK